MKKTILVIDDSPFVVNQIKEITAHTEYEVIGHAKTGEAGIEIFKELHPDIITLDIIMPGIDGMETAKEILNLDADANILMLSSLCDNGTLEEVKSIGLKYLLPKPIEAGLLLATFELLTKR
ncbi:response regulator [Anaeromicropila herbilytica]|uniref:Stage 0 sporulation protein A homolog n=1 Tax=Anaeromicropila herbilytica TaxID=2785025 RepID=A0A7R7IC97_9FIRM|nr:response regulator [Anaeromicropila herbilytica]BCN29646.1 response regulator [Anaeromicropila herbilytica]